MTNGLRQISIRCQAKLAASLNASRDVYFCRCCQQTFSCAKDEKAHRRSSSHYFQYLKINYVKKRYILQKDKYFVTVRAEPQCLSTNGSIKTSGHIFVTLDAKAEYSVRIMSCDPFVHPEGFEIQHRAFDLGKAILVSPGETVAIDVHFTTCVPVELVVPVGLRLYVNSKNLSFYIVREMTLHCSCDDLTLEAAMGDENYEMKSHQDAFPTPQRIHFPPKIRTDNKSELPMPAFKDPFELPSKLLPLQEYINGNRRGDASFMDDFTYKCFAEIKQLLAMPICKDNYHMKFDILLFLEEMAKKAQLMSQNIAAIRLKHLENGGYAVILPGLPERRPP
ncbi:hypothetical protein BIW11_04195, partial [Tropilaelaps mercedesae]